MNLIYAVTDFIALGGEVLWVLFAACLLLWLLILEQTIRILLMFLLMPPLGLTGLILAYVVALPIKNATAWWINGRLILPFRIYWWQTVVAPLAAGVVNWLHCS